MSLNVFVIFFVFVVWFCGSVMSLSLSGPKCHCLELMLQKSGYYGFMKELILWFQTLRTLTRALLANLKLILCICLLQRPVSCCNTSARTYLCCWQGISVCALCRVSYGDQCAGLQLEIYRAQTAPIINIIYNIIYYIIIYILYILYMETSVMVSSQKSIEPRRHLL